MATCREQLRAWISGNFHERESLPYDMSVFESRVSSLETGMAAMAGHTHAWADISGKPSFATVATTGAYTDLTGKPSLFSGAYADLTGKPTIPADVSARVTALEGWRAAKATKITDAVQNPTNANINILGIQVPTAASYTALFDLCTELKGKVNGILGVLVNREIMSA